MFRTENTAYHKVQWGSVDPSDLLTSEQNLSNETLKIMATITKQDPHAPDLCSFLLIGFVSVLFRFVVSVVVSVFVSVFGVGFVSVVVSVFGVGLWFRFCFGFVSVFVLWDHFSRLELKFKRGEPRTMFMSLSNFWKVLRKYTVVIFWNRFFCFRFLSGLWVSGCFWVFVGALGFRGQIKECR